MKFYANDHTNPLSRAKVDEIYSKHAAELEKEHKGEIAAKDFINEKIMKILKPDKISELISGESPKNTVLFLIQVQTG